MSEYVSIGYTKKTHGTKGNIKIQIKDQYVEDAGQVDVVFIQIKGKHVPFFVEDLNYGHQLILKLEDVDSLESATSITAKEIFIRAKDVLTDQDREFEVVDSSQYRKYEGYLILDTEVGNIGKIEEVIEYPQQEMAVVNYKNREVLIPLTPQLIDKIDDQQKQIHFNLPEGLLDL